MIAQMLSKTIYGTYYVSGIEGDQKNFRETKELRVTVKLCEDAKDAMHIDAENEAILNALYENDWQIGRAHV